MVPTQRKTFRCWRLPGGVGGFPRAGVVVEELVLSLESLFFEGFEGMEPGMYQEFGWDVLDLWGCSKSLCSFFGPIP